VDITQASRKEFLLNNISDPDGAINRMLATIDVAKSEYFKQEDKERIFEIVRQEVGVSEINSMIFECMRTLVIDAIERARALDAENLYLLFNLAAVYANQGNYDGVYGKEARKATPILSIL
jgi:hypothetical protein